MRLLRLDLGPGSPSIDLHPFVTVLSGLDAAQRNRVIKAARSLARGSTRGVEGLIQHQSLLVELDGSSKDLAPAVTEADVVIDGRGRSPLGLQVQIDQQKVQTEIDAVAVEELRADIDPAAKARVATLEHRLANLDSAERVRLDDQRAVSEALAAVAGLDPVTYEAPPGALALRRRLTDHRAQVASAEPHFERLMSAVKESEARLVQARRELAEAEAAARPALLDLDSEARLEQLSFPEMDETRRGRGRKMLSPDEEVEKQALLDKVGVESWTAYTVHRLDPRPSPERLEAAAGARWRLGRAEAGLAAARAALAGDELTAELNDEIEAIRAVARSFMGRDLPADLDAALGQLVVERDNPVWLDAVGLLCRILVQLDLDDLAGGDPHDVIDSARSWLEAGEREGGLDPETLAAELARARQRLARHERALGRIGRAETAAEVSASRLARLTERLATAGAGDGNPAPSGPVNAPTMLALVGAVAGQVRLDAGGSLPIVVAADLDRLGESEITELLDGLSELAQSVQIVVLSDHGAAARWAREAGLDRALATQPGLVRG
jgi:hypothetical protein